MTKEFYPALLTPFNENKQIDFKALDSLIEYNMAQKVDGLYVLGSSGETHNLNNKERILLLERTSQKVNKRIKLTAQVGTLNMQESLELIKIAEQNNYDSISAVTPFYYQYSLDEIKNYYNELAKSTTLPIIIYIIPHLSGVKLDLSAIKELVKIPNVQAFKYTSNDLFLMAEIKRIFPEIKIFSGFDELLLSSLIVGADGAIGTTFNFQAKTAIALSNALFKDRNILKAQELQYQMNTIISTALKYGIFQSSKYLLELEGITMGICRPPMAKVSEEGKINIQKLHRKFFI